jgi:glutaredoxin-related protein
MQNQTTIFIGLWDEKLINSAKKKSTEVYQVLENTSDLKKAATKVNIVGANAVLATKNITASALSFQNELVYFIDSRDISEILKVISNFNIKPQITIKGDFTEVVERRIKEIYTDYELTHAKGLTIVCNKAQKATKEEEEKK